jgi:hypothetical protein
MIRFSTLTKRLFFRKFHSERQADVWAFCTLLRIGAAEDALAIAAQSPEKNLLFWQSLAASAYAGLKFRLGNMLRKILRPAGAFVSALFHIFD